MVRRGPLPLVAVAAGLIANWLKISTALRCEGSPWITFLAGTGAIVLRFLAGAELDPNVFRAQVEGIDGGRQAGFLGPFLGAALEAHNVLGWAWRPSWLAGVTVSKTSVAVVYAVILELGFNQTTDGKAILAACFINDLGTVLALGSIFSPFTKKTLLLPAISLASLLICPSCRFFERYGAAHPNWRASTCCFCCPDLAA